MDPDLSFGARFLEEFRRLGGMTSKWRYEVVSRLEAASRSEVVALLKKGDSFLRYELIRCAETQEPEELARRIAEEDRPEGDAGACGWFLL
jgi:hypothetical protein